MIQCSKNVDFSPSAKLQIFPHFCSLCTTQHTTEKKWTGWTHIKEKMVPDKIK